MPFSVIGPRIRRYAFPSIAQIILIRIKHNSYYPEHFIKIFQNRDYGKRNRRIKLLRFASQSVQFVTETSLARGWTDLKNVHPSGEPIWPHPLRCGPNIRTSIKGIGRMMASNPTTRIALTLQIHCGDFERLFRASRPTAVMERARLVFFTAVRVKGLYVLRNEVNRPSVVS